MVNFKRVPKKQLLEFYVWDNMYGDVGMPDGSSSRVLKSHPGVTIVDVSESSEALADWFEKMIYYEMARYESKAATFGCCSKVEECSDALHCIHENKFYSKACMYRMNLDMGKVFYGKNKNIDKEGNVLFKVSMVDKRW